MATIVDPKRHAFHCLSCQSSNFIECDWLITKNGFLTQKTLNYGNGYIFPEISTLKNGGVGKIPQL